MYPFGDIKCKAGPMLAGACIVKITIKGKGGHGSFPERVNDPITALCAVHSNLHTIKSRNIKGDEHFVFTICTINGGSAPNVFPDEAYMEGTIRAFSKETMKQVMEKVKLISENTAMALDCTADV